MKSTKPSFNLRTAIWILLVPFAVFVTIWLRLNNTALMIGHPGRSFYLVMEFISYGLLGFSLTHFVSTFFEGNRTQYRITFLATTSIGLVLLLTTLSNVVALQTVLHLLLMTTAGFIGCFASSNLMNGFWENNEPPPPKIEEAVLKAHLPYMGSNTKKSFLKRFLDILLAVISILISFPIWLLIIFMIWWEEPGPVFFVKNSVGRGGINYRQLKFRSMITNAEKETGPISGYENDERVLFFGQFLRKTALDELPQLINILIGNMSYVGPRPQRTVLVHGYLQETPTYAARHRVRPGLAGLAQVADSYGISPEEKLAWDLVYIEQANLLFDIKLILAAFLLVFVVRWRAEKNPELIIRRLLNITKPKA